MINHAPSADALPTYRHDALHTTSCGAYALVGVLFLYVVVANLALMFPELFLCVSELPCDCRSDACQRYAYICGRCKVLARSMLVNVDLPTFRKTCDTIYTYRQFIVEETLR